VIAAFLLMVAVYDGKYVDDPRFERVQKAIPAQLAAARKRVGVTTKVRVRFVDLGKRPAGPVARTRRDEDGFFIVLYTEPLMLRAHDPVSTLAHELVHVRQREAWGTVRAQSMPPWIVEGMAVYLSGQLRSRAEDLAAHVGREPTATALINGLGGRHTLLDYAESAAAFDGVRARHGADKTKLWIEELLRGEDVRDACAKVLRERWVDFEERSKTHAHRVLDPLLGTGRDDILRLRKAVESKQFKSAVALPRSRGVYAVDDAYYRAVALHALGKHDKALALVRSGFLAHVVRRSTLLDRAIVLELRILKAQKKPIAFEGALKDLRPYGAYSELTSLRGEKG
jgi:hypothetical protein